MRITVQDADRALELCQMSNAQREELAELRSNKTLLASSQQAAHRILQSAARNQRFDVESETSSDAEG